MKKVENLESLSQQAPGIYKINAYISNEEIERYSSKNDFHLFYINGSQINDKSSFIRTAAKTMCFPNYVQANWDSFEEGIKDLEWCHKKGYVLLYENYDNFSQAKPEEWKVAFDILHSAVDFWGDFNAKPWKKKSTPMYVFLK